MSQPNLDNISVPTAESRVESPAPVTLMTCATCIVVALGVWSGPSDPTWGQMAKWGYLPAERIWDGALWALVTSAFVHVALWHLVFNVTWLWRFGGAVERTLGSIKFLGFLIAAGFISSACQLIVSGDTGIGASGIVYALMGFMWRKQDVPRFAAVLGPDTASLFFVWLVLCVVSTLAGFANIGNTAHISGLLFGMLLAEWPSLISRAPGASSRLTD